MNMIILLLISLVSVQSKAVVTHRKKYDRHLKKLPSDIISTREGAWTVKATQETMVDQNYDIVFLVQDHGGSPKEEMLKSLAAVISRAIGFEDELYEIGKVTLNSDGSTALNAQEISQTSNSYKNVPYPHFLTGKGCGTEQRQHKDFIMLSSEQPVKSVFYENMNDEIFKDQITVIITEGCHFCNGLKPRKIQNSGSDSLLLFAVGPSRVCQRHLSTLSRRNRKFQSIVLKNWMEAEKLSRMFTITSHNMRRKIRRIVRSTTEK